jgi:uncharacterized phage protein gp47/JayE
MNLFCTIDANGISAPDYNTILNALKSQAQNIFGTDIYLEPDSQDGQLLATMAASINDANSAAIAAYNSFSPSTAQGIGLSNVVKINGLQRLVPSNSTANITIIGQAGTIIANGIVEDANGLQWALPASVTVPVGGSIVVTATCKTPGAIAAAANTINQIATPTFGWQSANNAANAVPGAPVESDAELRVRQSKSTSLPAQTVIGGIYAAIANLSGVTQLKIYDNDTGSTDSNGIPAHSISVVVQGGDATAIAQAIALKKTPGTGTYGTTSETVVDSQGIPNTINFFAATQVPIDINITIKAYAGYVTTTGATIIAQLKKYLNGMGIGGTDNFVFNSKLYSPANDTGAVANSYNVTALTARRGSSSFSTANIAIAFNEIPIAGTVTLTVV